MRPVVTTSGFLGTVGGIGCFSFAATKNVTTGAGGMVVARDPDMLACIRRLRSHGMTASTWEWEQTGRSGYDVLDLGLNYQPTEIASAMGRVQLRKLPEDRRRRVDLVAHYHTRLAAVDGIKVPFRTRPGDAAHYLMVILLPPGARRDVVQGRLRRAGVQTSVHYPPTHRFSFFERTFDSARRPLPVTDGVADRLLSLPLHGRMSNADADGVIDALAAALAAA
jgi:dTDP-4-amino-4,6-dideoxygalactose transaminase